MANIYGHEADTTTPGGIVFRGEMFKLAYAVQPATETTAMPATTAYVHNFGVVQTATLPDPSVETFPIYALGDKRNPYVTYLGKYTLAGSIPDIWLLDGKTAGLAVGKCVTTTGTGATGTTGFASAVGVASGIPSGAYEHVILEQCGGGLPNIAIHATQYQSDCTPALMRRWYGGKVNRQTIEATEGDFLKAGFDEIVFANFKHNVTGTYQNTYYSTAVADCTGMTFSSAAPFLFSYGYLSLFDQEFARVRSFRLEINNNCEPKFYVQSQEGSVQRRLPYEYREGRREYRLSMQIDLKDVNLYKEMMNFGYASDVYKGFKFYARFTRNQYNDYIELYSPATTAGAIATPGAGGDAQGCFFRTVPHNIMTDPIISATTDIAMRNLGIRIVDTTSAYPYETL